MPENTEPVEAAIEAASEKFSITVGPTTSAVIFALATYGGVDLTRRAVKDIKTLRNRRKARKAAKTLESEDTATS